MRRARSLTVACCRNATGAPVNISNGASILLRYQQTITPLILAKGFDLRSGVTTVTVPWVEPSANYSVVLFGDSGNWSEEFTILE